MVEHRKLYHRNLYLIMTLTQIVRLLLKFVMLVAEVEMTYQVGPKEMLDMKRGWRLAVRKIN